MIIKSKGEHKMKVYEGKLVSEKIRVGIIAARFNEFITSKLLSGALDTLKRHNVEEEDIHVAWVPGAFEIPLIASTTENPYFSVNNAIISRVRNIYEFISLRI